MPSFTSMLFHTIAIHLFTFMSSYTNRISYGHRQQQLFEIVFRNYYDKNSIIIKCRNHNIVKIAFFRIILQDNSKKSIKILNILIYRQEIKYMHGITKICPIELKSWTIDFTSHQYSDSSPISDSLME